ncbi:DUF4215 domain-containing protein [archaeon]|nr:DUF4215 domain-containing protein [archaeon]
MFGADEATYWSDETELFFERSVVWLTEFVDTDGDGTPDFEDNCPCSYNPGQEDADGDGLGDICDNCPVNYNPNQADNDGDTLGNVCDICPDDTGNDADSDGFCYPVDCVDTDNTIYPGADETVCNGIDNDCDILLDEDYEEVSCGEGDCSGMTSCEFGEIFCKNQEINQAGSDCGTCCQCENDNDPQEVYDGAQDLDCSGNNLPGISTCNSDPDNNPMTYDTAVGFISECSAIDVCTEGEYEFNHECDVDSCDAECEDGNFEDGDGCSSSCILEICGDNILHETLGEECDDGNTVDLDGCDASCVIEYCGDGIDNDADNEECDDGNDVDDDACSNLCVTNYCGDSITNNGEECDDGNTVDLDGCSALCLDEYCGDGIDNDADNEECDDGNDVDDDACSNLCVTNYCGDSITNNGEECDDGNNADGDGCSALCLDEYCGDGIPQPGEQCDDGNNVNGDGCDSLCVSEVCGNGIPQFGEVCDDGNLDDTDACLSDCTAPVCGDSIVWFGHEECDDGANGIDTDECTDSCTLTYCGDQTLQIWNGNNEVEECDDGADGDDTNTCYDDCSFTYCGDSIVQDPNGYGVSEVCDGNSIVCENFEGYAGTRECQSSCRGFEDCHTDEYCGDSITNGLEECDDGNNVNNDGCDAFCVIEYCGDSITNGLEECDDGNNDDGDGCDASCYDEICGNNILQFGEQCDDGNNDDEDGCSSQCVIESCGDTIVQLGLGEECDDGQGDNTDSCLDTCMDAECGDTFVWDGQEECDDGNTIDLDGCDASCVIEYCGDGIINNVNEICDEGIDNGEPLHCDAECGGITLPVCGNSYLEEGEECDDSNVENNDGCNSVCVLEICGDGIVQDGIGEECEYDNQCNDQDYHTADYCVECGCENPIICEDECLPTSEDICSEDSDSILECRNDFDSDPCYEYGPKYDCTNNEACTVIDLDEAYCGSCQTNCGGKCYYTQTIYGEWSCGEGDCLYTPVIEFIDIDNDYIDDRCDDCIDLDKDGICDHEDTCPDVYNPTNVDTDGDGVGNACDYDRDNDGYDASVDCHDWDKDINPGMKEIKGDGKDNDCDPLTSDKEIKIRSQDLLLGTKIMNEDTAIDDRELRVAVYVKNKGSKTAKNIKLKATLLDEYVSDETIMPTLKAGKTSRVILNIPLYGGVMPDEYYLRTTLSVETVKKAKYSQVLLH